MEMGSATILFREMGSATILFRSPDRTKRLLQTILLHNNISPFVSAEWDILCQ